LHGSATDAGQQTFVGELQPTWVMIAFYLRAAAAAAKKNPRKMRGF
jgi:hypothetical protein